MTDDGGVLGNLPRSRPGHRSEKRTGRTAGKAAARTERSGAQTGPAPRARKTASAAPKAATGRAPKRAAGARQAATGGRKGATGAPKGAAGPSAPPSRAGSGGDPVGDAIRTVAGVASTGARVAGGVAREVLRRLPRP